MQITRLAWIFQVPFLEPFWSSCPATLRLLFAVLSNGGVPLYLGKGVEKRAKKVSKKRRKKSRKTQGKKCSPAGSRGFLGLSFLALFSSSFLLFFIDFSFSWNCVPHTTAGGKVAEKRTKKVRRKMMKNVKNSSAI